MNFIAGVNFTIGNNDYIVVEVWNYAGSRLVTTFNFTTNKFKQVSMDKLKELQPKMRFTRTNELLKRMTNDIKGLPN